MVIHKGFVQTFQANFTIQTLVAGPATWVTFWTEDLRYQIAGSYAWADSFLDPFGRSLGVRQTVKN